MKHILYFIKQFFHATTLPCYFSLGILKQVCINLKKSTFSKNIIEN